MTDISFKDSSELEETEHRLSTHGFTLRVSSFRSDVVGFCRIQNMKPYTWNSG